MVYLYDKQIKLTLVGSVFDKVKYVHCTFVSIKMNKNHFYNEIVKDLQIEFYCCNLNNT